MDYRKTIEGMPADVYERLKRGLELGRWPDGTTLSDAQKTDAMQAVIAWGELHLPEDQRIGHIEKGSKQGKSCDDPEPLKWRD